MSCMKLDFATKVELEYWVVKFEDGVWITADVMKGLLRKLETNKIID